MNAARMVGAMVRARSAAAVWLEARRQPAVGGVEAEARSAAPALPLHLCLSIVASAIAALIVAIVGWAMPGLPTPAELDEPVQIRAIESDLAEPFVVCVTRAGVTRCRERDLRSDP